MSHERQNALNWWKPKIDWDCKAGKLLKKFFAEIPEKPVEITIFGSACLQLCLKKDFLSADVDFFSQRDFNQLIYDLKLGKEQSEFYLEQPPAKTFIAPIDWRDRAYTELIDGISVIFPHPLDILTSKVKRLEPKDLNAFFLVRDLTDHPTEKEMIESLQAIVDIYRPAFDEEKPGGDPIINTRRLWKEFFLKDIDVRKEIIRPALEERQKYYDPLPLSKKALIQKLKEQD